MRELQRKKYVKFMVASAFIIVTLLFLSYWALAATAFEVYHIREILIDRMKSTNLTNIHTPDNDFIIKHENTLN